MTSCPPADGPPWVPDDGIGVAMAMAVLDDDTLSHPALEVLFTTAEEDDFPVLSTLT